ncbi:MAG: 4-hydroxy-tetrahydrodipicolinate reductase, partial [Bdellovibrionota bacterium]
MIAVGILGARGRMGEWVKKLLEKEFAEKARLTVNVSRGDSLEALLKCDAVIDFSSPEGMIELARAALLAGANLPAFVIGS